MNDRHQMRTKRGYDFGEVSSALQKAIRRADGRLAGYWAIELHESGYGNYLWKRLLTISAEDCAGVITKEILALHQAWLLIRKGKPDGGRIFAAKATLLLASVAKSRDADHLTNLVYDRNRGVSDETIERELADARASKIPIPDYAFDVHTSEGKRRGKTKADFFVDEHRALKPRVPGLFDDDVESIRLPRR